MEFSSLSVWKLQPSTQFLKDRTWYDKKHPAELAAVLNNLQRFITLASTTPNSRAVQAGYVHTEGKGVLAVDERAGGPNFAPPAFTSTPTTRPEFCMLSLLGIKIRNKVTPVTVTSS